MRFPSCQLSYLGFVACVLLQTPADATVTASAVTGTPREIAATVNDKPIYASAIDTQIIAKQNKEDLNTIPERVRFQNNVRSVQQRS